MLWCQMKVWRSWIERLCVPPHKVGRRSVWLFRLSPLSPTLASWLKNLQERQRKRSVKTNKKHFKTIPHKFLLVPLNFTFPIVALKEANHHIPFVFHPYARPKRMNSKKQMEWEPNLSHVSAERPKKTHSLTNKTCSSEMDIFTRIAPRRTTARWLFNGKQGKGVGRITNLKKSNVLCKRSHPGCWVNTTVLGLYTNKQI